jgi:hypothetical protein
MLGYYYGIYYFYSYEYMFWVDPIIAILLILVIMMINFYNRTCKKLIHFEPQNLQIKLKNDLDLA